MKFYCLSEKKHVDIARPEYVRTADGRPKATGVCPSCGKRVMRTVAETDVPPEKRGKLPKYTGSTKKSSKSGGSRSKSGRKSGRKSGTKSGKRAK